MRVLGRFQIFSWGVLGRAERSLWRILGGGDGGIGCGGCVGVFVVVGGGSGGLGSEMLVVSLEGEEDLGYVMNALMP